MTLSFSTLEAPIFFEENVINVLIIENPYMLRNYLTELSNQIAGEKGSIILADKNGSKDIAKMVALVIDPFHLDFSLRKIMTKINEEVSKTAVELHEERLFKLISEINELASELAMDVDFEAAFEPIESASDLIRLLSFHPDVGAMDFPEKIFEWIRLQKAYNGKELFIFYGLKSLMSDEELSVFYKGIFYEKTQLLLIEPSQNGCMLEGECLTIVDEDLCVLK